MRLFLTFIFLAPVFGFFACAPSPIKRIPISTQIKVKPSEKFHWPLANASLLSKFGKRGKGFHTGIDIRARLTGGDAVVASRAGRVMSVGWVKGYGKQIKIHHSDGYETRYAHLKSIKIKLGERVKTGQTIGIVGATGRASTPHLHFEIITPGGDFIDPFLLLP
ncbi:MAG: hypothetical protein KCHDKBKB_01468 [Elusimicrobia bacterium]|nr:hypothetical protein [Elusimicrobiota bacterium]